MGKGDIISISFLTFKSFQSQIPINIVKICLKHVTNTRTKPNWFLPFKASFIYWPTQLNILQQKLLRLFLLMCGWYWHQKWPTAFKYSDDITPRRHASVVMATAIHSHRSLHCPLYLCVAWQCMWLHHGLNKRQSSLIPHSFFFFISPWSSSLPPFPPINPLLLELHWPGVICLGVQRHSNTAGEMLSDCPSGNFLLEP